MERLSKEPLFIHQRKGIDWLINTTRGLLADEAGLGKTRQLLEAAMMVMERSHRKCLVLCPTSIVENWLVQAEKWGFPLDRLVVKGYEYRFLADIANLLTGRYAVIIADEAHFLKNWKSQRTKKFRDLLKGRDSRVWLASGTPLVKGAMDLHPLLSFIEPGKWGKYKEFCDRYCRVRPNRWVPGGVEYYGIKNEKLLNQQMEAITLRRYKRDCLVDLPPKLYSKIPLDVPVNALSPFSNDGVLREILRNVDKGGRVGLSKEVAATVQELGMRKVEHVVKFIVDVLHPHPVVVFAHHRLVLYDLAEKLREKGRKVQVILGGMDKRSKWQYIKEFHAGKLDDLVVGVLAGGVGIDLFKSSRCVFAEFPWTWAAMDQAADRLHRIGQRDCVNVYQCVAKNTFEDRMLAAIEARRSMLEDTVGI